MTTALADLLAPLSLLIWALILWYPSILLNRKWLEKNPGNRSYAWGYFIALMAISLGCGLAVLGLAELSEPGGDSGSSIILGLLSTLLGVLIFKRNRWGWLAFVVLGLNPAAWIINGVYLKNRWQEMKVATRPASD